MEPKAKTANLKTELSTLIQKVDFLKKQVANRDAIIQALNKECKALKKEKEEFRKSVAEKDEQRKKLP